MFLSSLMIAVLAACVLRAVKGVTIGEDQEIALKVALLIIFTQMILAAVELTRVSSETQALSFLGDGIGLIAVLIALIEVVKKLRPLADTSTTNE